MAAKFCYHDAMRTTVTIDPAVERLIKRAMAVRGHSFKRTLNDAVRAGLADIDGEDEEPFVVHARPLGVRPGVDSGSFNALIGELEDEATGDVTRRLLAAGQRDDV